MIFLLRYFELLRVCTSTASMVEMCPIMSCHAGVYQQSRQLPVCLKIGGEFVAEGETEWNQLGDAENQVQLEPEQCQY